MAEIVNIFAGGKGLTAADRTQIIADAVSASGGTLTAGSAGTEPTTGLVAFTTQFYDTTNLVKKIWDGASWVVIGDGTISAAQIADITANTSHAGSAHAPANAEPNLPLSGSTTSKTALVPNTGQTFYDTDLGKSQYFDGTNWVDAIYSAPSLGGSVGIPPSTKYRVYIDARGANTLQILLYKIAFYSDSSYLTEITGKTGVSSKAQKSTGSTTYTENTSFSNDWYNSTISAVVGNELYIDLTLPSAQAVLSWRVLASTASTSGTYLPSAYRLAVSNDGGVSYSVIDTHTGLTNSGAAGASYSFVTPAPDYPANPLIGQLFYNESISEQMRYSSSGWVSATINQAWSPVSSAYTATSWDMLMVDTSAAAVTVTLPAAPAAGDEIKLMDAAGSWATNNLSIAPNGNTLLGVTTTHIVAVSDQTMVLVYTGTDWRIL